MEVILEYIKPILYFVILEAVLLNIVTDKGFKKIIKMFCGIVLILLIISPVKKVLAFFDGEKAYGNLLKYDNGNIMNQYEEEYKKIIDVNIKSIVETQGMEVVEFTPDYTAEQGVILNSLKLIVKENTSKLGEIDIKDTEISISDIEIVAEKEETSAANETLIKIQNDIMGTYNLEKEKVIIRVVD